MAVARWHGLGPRGLAQRLLILLAGIVLPLLAGGAQGADQETCRRLRQQRDALALQAMEDELVLVRRFRSRLCPQLAEQAEGANANDQRYGPLDYAAWSQCRQEAERQLEGSLPMRYRNDQGFVFYTPSGASLARQADQRSAAIKGEGCR